MKLTAEQVQGIKWREPEHPSSQVQGVALIEPEHELFGIMDAQSAWPLVDTSEDMVTAGLGALVVQFRSGGLYVYEQVRSNSVDALLAAPSAGRYLNHQIKPHRRYVRVEVDEGVSTE